MMNPVRAREYISAFKAKDYTCQGKSWVYDEIKAENFPAVVDLTTGRPRYKIPTYFLLQWQEERIKELENDLANFIAKEKAKINKLKVKNRELKEYYYGR